MPIEDTVNAIRAADRARRRSLAAKRRLLRPVAQLDQVLVELEELHLRGAVKVPVSMIAEIESFMRTVPLECQAEFPLRTTITRVMDNLYAVQDCLLSRKDRRRAGLKDIDSALEAAMGADDSAA